MQQEKYSELKLVEKKYVKKQPISSLKEWDIVDDVFVVKIKKGMSKYTNGYSFQLLLSDNTGKTIDYRYWGATDESKVKAIYDSIRPDSVVHVQGRVSNYNGKLQLTTNEPFTIKVLEEDQYTKTDFVKPPKKNIDEMYAKLKETINSVENKKIKELLTNIFNDPVIEKKFKTHPGSIEIHHNWIGGLLEHTLEILNYCELSWKQFPQMNKDLLIAGALLHDIGKLDELVVTSRIKGSNLGQLTGHLVLSAIYVSNKMDEIAGFDDDIKSKILHLIVSHHGKPEFGSPKEPMFPEAIALHYADELSSKIAEIIEFIESAKSDTEDDFMYSQRKGRNILLR